MKRIKRIAKTKSNNSDRRRLCNVSYAYSTVFVRLVLGTLSVILPGNGDDNDNNNNTQNSRDNDKSNTNTNDYCCNIGECAVWFVQWDTHGIALFDTGTTSHSLQQVRKCFGVPTRNWPISSCLTVFSLLWAQFRKVHSITSWMVLLALSGTDCIKSYGQLKALRIEVLFEYREKDTYWISRKILRPYFSWPLSTLLPSL